MKKIIGLIFAFVLASCGTIGIGSNHNTNIYNNSDNVINVKADSGVYKIKPDSSMEITSANDMTITSSEKSCSEKTVVRVPNAPAMILDVIPGFFFGIVPLLIDAVSNNLYRMPESYSYSCM